MSMGFPRQEYWSGLPFLRPGDLPNPGIDPVSPTLQVDSLPVEPPGKPKNTAVGSISLLQGIFPTHKSNWGLPHCRWILYQAELPGKPCVILGYPIGNIHPTHLLSDKEGFLFCMRPREVKGYVAGSGCTNIPATWAM